MAKTEAIDLVGMLSKAGESDLVAVEKRIADLRSEIDKYIEVRKRELASLTTVKKVLQFKLHGRPARKVSANGKKVGSELAIQIHDLLTEHGSLPVDAIAARLGAKRQAVAMCCQKSPWFTRTGNDVSIAVKE